MKTILSFLLSPWREVLRHFPGISAAFNVGIDGAMPSTRRDAEIAPYRLGRLGIRTIGIATVCAVSLSAASALPLQLLSTRDVLIPLPTGANDNSVDSVVSADGRYILFSSAASDLLPGHERSFNLDVYLFDPFSGLSLVSAGISGTNGGDSSSRFSQVSTNGQFVLFQSDADNLINGDTNGAGDIFLRDLVAGTTELVSVSTNGGSAFGSSSDAAMTPDARYVVFTSSAANLVPADNNTIPDVFLRDRLSGTTTLVSTGAVNNLNIPLQFPAVPVMATPSVTPDGRYVAFFSTAALLVGTNRPIGGEVYVRDTVAGTTTWASSNVMAMAYSVFGTSNYYSSYHPVLSSDGRYLAFKAVASTTGPFTNAIVLQADLVAGTLSIIDTNALGLGPRDEDRFGPEMTPDGRYIVYVHHEPVTDTNVYSSVHVWDTQTLTDVLVSDAGGVPPNTMSDTPVITPDGRFVVFLSNIGNLVTNVLSGGMHIYLKDLQSNITQLIDVDTDGVGSMDMTGVVPSVSADGRFVVFEAPDGSLVPGDTNKKSDVFERDTVLGVTTMISSRSPALVPSTGDAITRMAPGSVSADGRWMVFESSADDLVPNDANGFSDVFVEDLMSGQRTLVSAGMDGNPAVGGSSSHGVISADGRYVAFLSSATNVVSGVTNGIMNVYRRDLQSGTTLLVSVTNSIGTSWDCYGPLISSNGQFVTFYSTSTALVPSTPSGMNVFQRDMNLGVTTLLVGQNLALSNYRLTPTMSLDGRYVSYLGPSGLRVRDMQSGLDIYTNTIPPSIAVLSPNGSRILYGPGNPAVYGPNNHFLVADDVRSGTNVFALYSRATQLYQGQWSTDGRFLGLVSSTNQALGIDDQTNRIYLCDLAANTVTLVSVNYSHSAPAIGVADMPVITGDGRYIVYRSTALDLVANDLNPVPKLFAYDTLGGTNRILVPAQTDTSPFPWISMPTVSGGGEAVAFQSMGSSLVSPDLNRDPDAFVIGLAIGNFAVQIVPAGGSSADLTWSALTTTNFTVQYKNNLSDALWSDQAGSIVIQTNRAYFNVPIDQAHRFYRVLGMP